ncbi:MAG TPA: hypothetical protein PKX80_10585 [Flexilinea sp.]|jgi:hypothetical protein|nr:hypothetical protein [Flexilinea sp.]MBP8965500.1 hypothetical protein [Flexilinea sp.]HNY93989.1 hypothetical protein [Flexilinea sp.]HOG21979.1 hypothetical protein [Flexilinea sp.]HPL56873.1 hypothetical protein [Flexilinea sp.]
MSDKNWKRNTLLIGAGIGLLAGLLSAYLRIRKAESNNEIITFKAKDTAKIGTAVFDFMKKFL